LNLQDLIQEVRRRSDMENSGFVTDPEITNYINNSASELYDILVSRFEDYYTQLPLAFNIASGTTYTLPADFYKLRGVDKDFGGGDFASLSKFNFQERNRQNNSLSRALSRRPDVQYRIIGKELVITPTDTATGDYRLWYIPQFDKLVDLTDELDTIQGWEEYVIVDAAIKCMQKEESDVSVLLVQKQALISRIEAMANNRDAGEPESITDVYRGDGLFGDY